MNIANSKPMVDCLKLLCPAVSPIRDNRPNVHGIFDRDLSIGQIGLVILYRTWNFCYFSSQPFCVGLQLFKIGIGNFKLETRFLA